MENQIQLFKNEQFGDVRTVLQNGEPWFVAADVCKALEIGNPSQALSNLDEDEKMTLTNNEGHSGQRGGAQMMSIINEPGLYSLVIRSRKPEAKAFRRWITHEVIPSIRKHGLYAADELLANPDLFIKVLQDLKEERARAAQLATQNAVQSQQIAEMQPKVSYYDLILQNQSVMPIVQIAKDYGFSARAMNQKLHELGVQYKSGGVWLLYQKYAPEGYTQTRTYLNDDGACNVHTYWTQKGRLFLYDLLKRKGILPRIEQNNEEACA